MPSQPEDELVLVLSAAGDWSVNTEPNKLLVSKTLAVLRSCLIASWSTSDHAMICRAVSGLVVLPALWFLRSAEVCDSPKLNCGLGCPHSQTLHVQRKGENS